MIRNRLAHHRRFSYKQSIWQSEYGDATRQSTQIMELWESHFRKSLHEMLHLSGNSRVKRGGGVGWWGCGVSEGRKIRLREVQFNRIYNNLWNAFKKYIFIIEYRLNAIFRCGVGGWSTTPHTNTFQFHTKDTRQEDIQIKSIIQFYTI